MKETGFDRGGWLALLISLAMILTALSAIRYQAGLPTDGWYSSTPNDLTTVGFIYRQNLAELPSPLQPGDLLIEVGGVPVDQLEAESPQARAWAAMESLRYTVLRGEERLTFDVPITRWTLEAWWRFAAGQMANWLPALFLFVISLFTFIKRPRNHAAQSLLIIGGSVFSLTTLGLFPNSAEGVALSFDSTALLFNVLLIALGFSLIFPPTLVRFALVFPRPVGAVLQRPWLEILPYGIGLLVLVSFFTGTLTFGWIWMVLAIIAAIAILIYKWVALQDTVSRLQMRWGVGGTALGLGLFLLDYPVVFGWVTGPLASLFANLSNLAFPIMGVSLAIAILRYRLFDIEVIIRRTLVYGLLTLLLGAIYLVSVGAIQQIFRAVTGATSQVAVVISTLGIAALFNPLRRRVQGVIDRRFYRLRYDAENITAEFSRTVRDQVDFDQLSQYLLQVSRETMHPEHISLWLSTPKKDGIK